VSGIVSDSITHKETKTEEYIDFKEEEEKTYRHATTRATS